MDSHKIFIDTDTEITFIIEKILEAKNDRVVIVVPDRASFLSSIINLKIVKRIVDRSRKLLIIVTMDEPCANLATSENLHVVPRIGEITEKDWDLVQKQKFDSIKKSQGHRFTSENKEEVEANNSKAEKNDQPGDEDTQEALQDLNPGEDVDLGEMEEITDLESFLKSEAQMQERDKISNKKKEEQLEEHEEFVRFSKDESQPIRESKEETKLDTNAEKHAKMDSKDMRIKSRPSRKRKQSISKESLNFEFKQDLKKKFEE